MGCLAILALLGAILLRCVWLARRSRDPLFASVAMGVAGMFGAQTLLNVGMCLYVAPVVGVTLPFFSYGGSSLITAFGAIGLVLSMKKERLGGSGSSLLMAFGAVGILLSMRQGELGGNGSWLRG